MDRGLGRIGEDQAVDGVVSPVLRFLFLLGSWPLRFGEKYQRRGKVVAEESEWSCRNIFCQLRVAGCFPGVWRVLNGTNNQSPTMPALLRRTTYMYKTYLSTVVGGRRLSKLSDSEMFSLGRCVGSSLCPSTGDPETHLVLLL